MKYEHITVREAIDLSPHHHAYVNPYNGCTVGCPYCFWLSRPGWENRIQIKDNIAEVLEEELKNWPKEEFIYFGSVCDPFMEEEAKYGLSRKCLELIERYEVPLLITTSATNDVVRHNADILMRMKQRVIVVVELSRIPLVEAMNAGGEHRGIQNANHLDDLGLTVWATLSPILPGITDLDVVLGQLHDRIPVYVDSLQCETGSIQEQRVLNWIRQDYPALLPVYEKIVVEHDLGYFTKILDEHKNNRRVLTFPFRFD